MSSVAVPALLAGVSVLVVIGLPAPQRVLVRRAVVRPEVPDAVLAGAVVAVLFVSVGPVGAGVGGVLAVFARRAHRSMKEGRRRDAETAAAAEAMAVLAAELRVGRPTGIALGNAATVALGPTAMALAEAGSATGLGAGAADTLIRHADASSVGALLRGLAACLEVCQASGGSLAAAVDRLEDAVRAEQECRDEVRTELAGPRSTAFLLAALPVVGLLLGAAMGARPLHTLLHTAVGGACLVVGVVLDLTGLWWTGRIMRRAEGSA